MNGWVGWRQRRVGARLQRGDEVRRLTGPGDVEVGGVLDAVFGAVELLGGEEVDRAVAEATPPPPPTATTPQFSSVPVVFQCSWLVLAEGSQERVAGLPGAFVVALGDQVSG